MKNIKSRLLLTLLLLLISMPTVSSAASLPEERVWVDIDAEQAVSFAWENTDVYEKPDMRSKIIGKLLKSPDNVDDIVIESARVLTDGGEEDFEIYEAWWFIVQPLKGWVEGPKLGLWNSGFLQGE